VVEEPIEERHRGRVLGQEVAPRLERPVAGQPKAAPLIGGGHEPEEELGPGVVERGE
jgi:hypothetical protein